MTNLASQLNSDFETKGVVCPVDILNPQETAYFRKKMTDFLDENHWKLDAVNRHKPHMYLKWANDLGRHPNVLAAIRPLLGENILLWYSVIFVKPAKSAIQVPWHQDSTYWALDKNEGLTVWIGLTDVNELNGCMEYIPGSHKTQNHEHSIDNSPDNLLARGQMIKNLDKHKTEMMILKPGQASIHHPSVLHCSKANNSDGPRLGIAFRYIPASNFPATLKWLKRSATLVCGEDKLQKFIKDPVPAFDNDPKALKAHKRSVRVAAIHTLFGDSSRTSWRKLTDLVPILLTRKTLQYLRYLKLPFGQNNDS